MAAVRRAFAAHDAMAPPVAPPFGLWGPEVPGEGGPEGGLPQEIVASAPSGRRRPAAVLIPVFEEAGEAWMVLTRRSSALRFHTGEVSFPGGRIDEGETAQSAALREAYEEVGIEPGSVEVVGQLSTISTVRNPAPITPFVGLLSGGRPRLVPSPAEVERVITVDVAELFADHVHREERWALGELGERPFYFFELVGDTVWGATARVLREFLEVVWAALTA